jgi:signal transduction histidine kinase
MREVSTLPTAPLLRVLIVEDSEDDAKLAVLQLRRAGLELVTERVETEEGLKRALDGRHWDVVLSDYSLPAFSGKVALDVVRSCGHDVPFIIVSGSLGEDKAVEMMKAGAHDFFAKSDLAKLAPAVEREVREAAQRRVRNAERKHAEEERRRLMLELREAVSARETFLTLAAHELRTPLTSAQLKLERLLRRMDDGSETMQKEALEPSLMFIARQQRRLAALVDNLIEVAAITSGRQTLSRSPVNLKQEVCETLAFLKEELRACGSSVSVRAAREVVGSWDRSRMRTVIRNLLGNAVKYGEGKPIEVTIASDRGRATMTVVDHGVGIGPEEQARIFNKFEHAIPEHHHEGFGLGLWIARRVLEAHGGTIRVTSRQGEGATFAIELPIEAR